MFPRLALNLGSSCLSLLSVEIVESIEIIWLYIVENIEPCLALSELLKLRGGASWKPLNLWLAREEI
jgi:hypothetical protein